jgi:hypothetical protein
MKYCTDCISASELPDIPRRNEPSLNAAAENVVSGYYVEPAVLCLKRSLCSQTTGAAVNIRKIEVGCFLISLGSRGTWM